MTIVENTTGKVNYKHPYITIQIFDNTEFIDEEVVEERKSFNGMQVGFFSGGRDNQLLYMLNRTNNLREFGKPNFKSFGQAGYNVDNALATENCGMYVMNLRPETATYANIVIMVRFKVDGLNNTEEPPVGGDGDNTGSGDNSGTGTGGGTTEGGGDDLKDPDGGNGTGTGDGEQPGGNTGGTTTGGSTGGGIGEGEIGEGEVDWDAESLADDIPVEDEATGPRLLYSFYPKYIENATTEDEVTTAALDLMQTDPDEDGYYNMPLFLFYTQGRGDYGNYIHLQFTNSTEYVTEEDVFLGYVAPIRHEYALTVMEPATEGLEKREIAYGTFDINAFDPSIEYGPSLFLEDIINDLETGSLRIRSTVYQETFKIMMTLYNTYVSPDDKATEGTFDILTQKKISGDIDTGLVLDTDTEDYINIFSLDGFTMRGGSDGWDDMSEAEIIAKKEDLLIKAYAGEIDPYIKSRFSSPVNFNLDANYSIKVKKQMANLAAMRQYDCMTYLDMNLMKTTSALLSQAKVMRPIYGFNVIKEGHCYKLRDMTYTGKVCDFTITHWLAKALPNHMASDDTLYGIPMARDLAILRSGVDYAPKTFLPVIDPDSLDVKERLYQLRVNIYETLTYNSVQRSTAITSCQTYSDRLLEMNEYILQYAVKNAYDLLATKLYKLGEASDRARYEQEASDVIEHRLGKYVRAVSLEFEMTPADEKKSLLRLKLHMTFKTVIQRGELEIYLDPRVVDSVIAA